MEFPEGGLLYANLSSALETEGILKGRQLLITERCPNSHASTFPSEVVKCRLDDKREFQIFCKYSDNQRNCAFGHRGGINYEIEVYRNLLSMMDTTVPRFYGSGIANGEINSWLFLEFVENCVRVTRSTDPEAMLEAARWIGYFHSYCSSIVSDEEFDFLTKYNYDYYLGWAERTLLFARNADFVNTWLETLCMRFIDVVDILFEAPLTIIHGEYYPKNIMFREGVIYPVDWESAALSVGEIDIASLSEGWGENHIQKFEAEYISARWPNGVSYDVRRIICAARIYLYFRWLGERPEWAASRVKDLADLQKAAENLGLI